MSKALERRAKFREELILAAERSISAGGLAGLKTRELAREIGVANGAVYNLVDDMDELILRVGSRTLARLDASLTAAESDGPASPRETLVRIAVAYCDFAAENLELWRALFEHRMAPGKPVPEWAIDEQMNLFRHIYRPLAELFPKRTPARTGRDGAQSFLRRARHGAARPRAKADRGAGRCVAEGNCGHRGRDGRWADGKNELGLDDDVAVLDVHRKRLGHVRPLLQFLAAFDRDRIGADLHPLRIEI